MSDEIEKVKDFYSETDFDFKTKEGWEAYLNERSMGGTGRFADGVQRRDFNSYPVNAVTVCAIGEPVNVSVKVKTQNERIPIPPGNIFFYYPDANWDMQVLAMNVGPQGERTQPEETNFQAGGGGSPEHPMWGTIYYVPIKAEGFPGSDAIADKGKEALKDTLKDARRLFRVGGKLLMHGGPFYVITITVGSNTETKPIYVGQYTYDEDAAKMMDAIDNFRRQFR